MAKQSDTKPASGAAAPEAMSQRDELLEACKWLLDEWRSYADQRYLTPEEIAKRDAARAAIAKAENQS